MKRFFVAMVVALAGAAFAQDASEQYMAERERILDQRVAGKLSTLEAAKEIEAAGKAYFPNDFLLHAYNASITGYSEELNRGAITREKYAELYEQRSERFDKAAAARTQAAEKTQTAGNSVAPPLAGPSSLGIFLSSVARSLNRTYPRPVTCSSTSIPGVITTNCQ